MSQNNQIPAPADFSARRQIGFGYVEFAEHGCFYKSVSAETLNYVTMLANGSPEMNGEGLNEAAVDFHLIDDEQAQTCRLAHAELLINAESIQGAEFWNGVQLPEFVLQLIAEKKLIPFFRVGKNIAGFTVKSLDRRNVHFFVQPELEDARTYEYLARFTFVDAAADPEGNNPIAESDDSDKAEEFARKLIYGKASDFKIKIRGK